jgi:hypothetical protein
MNVEEGATRMKRAGLWLAAAPAALGGLLICLQLVLIAGPGLGAIAGGIGILEVLLLAIPGVLLWIAGWIVEGFAKNTN